jgi:hypothetical protein
MRKQVSNLLRLHVKQFEPQEQRMNSMNLKKVLNGSYMKVSIRLKMAVLKLKTIIIKSGTLKR